MVFESLEQNIKFNKNETKSKMISRAQFERDELYASARNIRIADWK